MLLERIANIMIKDKQGGGAGGSLNGAAHHNTSMQSDSLARDSLTLTVNELSIERIEEQTRRIH